MPDKLKGFAIHCIHCGEGGVIQMYLHDMEFRCTACEADFTAADVRERMDAWRQVLAWIDMGQVILNPRGDA